MLESSPGTKSLLELIYNTGAETLFNLDILRHTHDAKSEDPIFLPLRAISTSDTKVLACLPRLFTSYVHVLQKHRGALFTQGSTQPSGTATEELKASGMCFFASCKSSLDVVVSDAQTWSIKLALLRLVNHEGFYNRNQADGSVLHHIIESALEILRTRWNGNYLFLLHSRCRVMYKRLLPAEDTETITYVIESLSTLTRIDYDLLSPALPDILCKILPVRMLPDIL